MKMFITVEEFEDLLRVACRELSMEVILERGKTRWHWASGSAFDGARIAYLIPAGTASLDLTSNLNSAALSWVLLEVPVVDGDVLYSVQLGARSDWFDRNAGVVHKTPMAVRRFLDVREVARRWLVCPVRVRGVRGGSNVDASIRCSNGAVEWFRQGRHLRQRGVKNVIYEPVLGV